MVQAGFKPTSMWIISIHIIIINIYDMNKQVKAVANLNCPFRESSNLIFSEILKRLNVDGWNSRNCRHTLYIKLLNHVLIDLSHPYTFLLVYKLFSSHQISIIGPYQCLVTGYCIRWYILISISCQEKAEWIKQNDEANKNSACWFPAN